MGSSAQPSLEITNTGRDTASASSPIIFVHGTGHAAWCWEYFARYFADAGYATYALSLRGHGGSAGAERLRWTSIAEYVADVHSVAEALDAPPILIGHSLGGFVVMRYLQKHPASAAVLLAPAPTSGMLIANWQIGLRYPIALLRCLVKLDFAQFFHSPQITHELLFRSTTPRAEVARWHPKISNESFRAAAALLWPLRGRRSFDCPMLLVGGTDDKVVPHRFHKKTAAALDADLLTIEGGTHELMLDRGWDEIAARIIEWLAANRLATA